MVDAMRAGGAVVDYHEYEGEGHGWSRADTIADALERIDAFLTRWVRRR
jgi:dipeptidyl aminopeptidase/acylaminoacyl peptidase